MSVVGNKKKFLEGLQAEPKEVKRKFGVTVMHVCLLLHEEITSLTPVNTGYALINYIWSMGDPVSEEKMPNTQGGTFGTNQMPLGSEPRRPGNMDEPNMTLAQLSFTNPFQRYYLTNSASDIEGLERGILPIGDGYTPRSPNGMFGISVQYVYARLQAGEI